MPSNDEVVLGIPTLLCPSCQSRFDTSKPHVEKFSKRQRDAMRSETNQSNSSKSAGPLSSFNGEDGTDHTPEHSFLVLSCPNQYCQQYNKIKVFRIQRVHTPSVKVDL